MHKRVVEFGGISRRRFLRGALAAGMVFGGPLRRVDALCAWGEGIAPVADGKSAVSRGLGFLESLWDPELELLPEFPGANVYWLFHDNYLAAKALRKSRPDMARRILARMHQWNVKSSGKIEILFGETAQPLPFHHHELREVGRTGGKLIKTEVVTASIHKTWKDYADLLCLAAMAEADREPVHARMLFKSALAFWDGVGLKDRVAEKTGIYATYKLALALWTAHRLQVREWIPSEMVARMLGQQNDRGGFRTDFDAKREPMGFANVETTSLAILAWERWMSDARPVPVHARKR